MCPLLALCTARPLQAVGYPLQNGTDYLAWRDLVTSGQLAALVRDTPALQWLANTAPLCNVALLPEQIEPFDYGIAFHVNTSEAVVDAWSTAILKLQVRGSARLGLAGLLCSLSSQSSQPLGMGARVSVCAGPSLTCAIGPACL